MGTFRSMLLFLVMVPLAQAETRVFVSLAGTLLQAEIAAVAGNNVTLKRTSDQQTIVVNLNTLCKEDGAYVARWLSQQPDQSATPAPVPSATAAPVQKYRLVCQTLPSKSNRSSGNSELRIFEHTYNFNLSNQEVQRDLEHARGVAFTLGKHAEVPNGDLIVLQKEEFDVTIRAQSKMVHATQPVRLTYYVGGDSPDTGVKIYGYVLIISDAAGNILLVEASPDASAKYTGEVLSLDRIPCIVDREFKLKSQSEVPLNYISY